MMRMHSFSRFLHLQEKDLMNFYYAVADLLETTPEFPMHEIEDEEEENSVLYKHEARS